MTYRRLIIGDPNIVRVWQAAQVSRPCLVGVPLKASSCLDTLNSGLADVNDELDYIIVSMLTSVLTEEGSSLDVCGSASNIISDAFKLISAAARKSSRVEVGY